MNKFGLLCAAAAIVAPVSAYAQQITAAIEGEVRSAAGAVLPGATVQVTDTRTGQTINLTADAEGRFAARNLTAGGPFTVAVSANGFQGQTVENLTTTTQGATTLTFTLCTTS